MKSSFLRRGRELAVQTLYQKDLTDAVIGDLLKSIDVTPGPSEDAKRLARELVCGVCEGLDEVDRRIQAVAEHWDLDRMPVIDRNCLRLACFELLFRRDVPFRVILDESIEVAKRYGSEDSGAFINGVLDAIARTERASEMVSPNDSSSIEGLPKEGS